MAFRRRNPRREGEQRASQVFARPTLLFRSRIELSTNVQTLALHHRTGLLKGHSCGPQVGSDCLTSETFETETIVRTSDDRPCTDKVQRDKLTLGGSHDDSCLLQKERI